MDRDLESIQQARDLLARAAAAQAEFAHATQERVDEVVRSVGGATEAASRELARSAVDETGMGRYEDKIAKNLFSSVDVVRYILPLKTCGVIRELPEVGVSELAVPMGVVAALTPTTNPTSTAIYKALIALKSRNAIVFSPHPRATRCVARTVEVIGEALRRSGVNPDLVLTMTVPTLDGTRELMGHEHTSIILATGGYAMVRAAYSSGKPAYGVGPGNVPAIVERTADVAEAVAHIVTGKSFDNGVLCSAENSMVCDAPVEQRVRDELRKNNAVLIAPADREKLEAAMRDPRSGGISAEIVGLSAPAIAQRAGLDVPANTRALVVECSLVGRDEFFSREKLSPVLALYIEDGWEKCCERSIELLQYGGLGHTLAIHSQDEHVIQRFFEEKPAFRVVVNTQAALGAVGLTTGLAPAMTLGPGTWTGSSTSDNITPLHLINVKRLARGIRSYEPVTDEATGPRGSAIDADEIRRVVEEFLRERQGGRT